MLKGMFGENLDEDLIVKSKARYPARPAIFKLRELTCTIVAPRLSRCLCPLLECTYATMSQVYGSFNFADLDDVFMTGPLTCLRAVVAPCFAL